MSRQPQAETHNMLVSTETRVSCCILPATVSAARRSACLTQQPRTHQGVRSAHLGERGGKARGQVRLAAGQREAARAQRGLELRDRQLRRRRVGVRFGRAVALEHLRGGRRRMQCSPTLPWRAPLPSALPDFYNWRQAANAAAHVKRLATHSDSGSCAISSLSTPPSMPRAGCLTGMRLHHVGAQAGRACAAHLGRRRGGQRLGARGGQHGRGRQRLAGGARVAGARGHAPRAHVAAAAPAARLVVDVPAALPAVTALPPCCGSGERVRRTRRTHAVPFRARHSPGRASTPVSVAARGTWGA